MSIVKKIAWGSAAAIGGFLSTAMAYSLWDYLTEPESVRRYRGKKLCQQRCLDGNCGKYALLHALQYLGIRTTMRTLYRKQGVSAATTPLRGTSAEEICRIAETFRGVTANILREDNGRAFKQQIDEALRWKAPLILSVEEGDHWVTITGLRGGKYHWIDSADDAYHGTMTWRALRSWIGEDDFEAVILCR